MGSLQVVWRFGLVGLLASLSPPKRPGRHPANGPLDEDSTASEDQLEWLVTTYGPTLYKVAFSITRSASLAEEVVQDAMLQAWSSMPSWDDDVPIKWMRRVVRNRAISVMRKENRSVAEEEWDMHVGTDAEVDRVVEGRHAIEAVASAMAMLDDESRLMLVLRETEDVSYDELGEMLEISPSAVKAKLYRARHALRTELREWDM